MSRADRFTVVGLCLVAIMLAAPTAAFARYSTRIKIKSSTLYVKTPGNEWDFSGLPAVPSSTIKGTVQYYSSKRKKWLPVGKGVLVKAHETELYDAARLSAVKKLYTRSDGTFTYRLPAGRTSDHGTCSRSFTFRYAGNKVRKSCSKSGVEVRYRPYLVLSETHAPKTITGSHAPFGPTASLAVIKSAGVRFQAWIYWPGATQRETEYPYQLGEVGIEIQRMDATGQWVGHESAWTQCAKTNTWQNHVDMFDPVYGTGYYRMRARYASYHGAPWSPDTWVGDYDRTLQWRYFVVVD